MYKIAILFIPLLSLFSADNLNLENKNLDIKLTEPKQTITKTKKDYEKKEDSVLTKGVKPLKKTEDKKDDSLEINGSIDINQETKTIDNVNVNVGTKF